MPSLLPPSQGRLLSFYKVLFKVLFKVRKIPEILLANLKVSAVSWHLLHCPILGSRADVTPLSHPEGAEQPALSQAHSCRHVAADSV